MHIILFIDFRFSFFLWLFLCEHLFVFLVLFGGSGGSGQKTRIDVPLRQTCQF